MAELDVLLSERRILRILWGYKRAMMLSNGFQLTDEFKSDIASMYIKMINVDREIADYIEQANITIYLGSGVEMKINNEEN